MTNGCRQKPSKERNHSNRFHLEQILTYHPKMMDIDNNYLSLDSFDNMINNDVWMNLMTRDTNIDDSMNPDRNIPNNWLNIIDRHFHWNQNNFHWDIDLNIVSHFDRIENLLNMIYNHLPMVLIECSLRDIHSMDGIYLYKFDR